MIGRKITLALLLAFGMACSALGATSAESIVARDAAITAAAESGYDDCANAVADFATANAYYYSARAMLVDWENQV